MFQQNVTQGPGSGTFTQHTFEILIMLFGAFLLGLWLGWILWSRYKQLVEKLSLENQSLQTSVDAFRTELAIAKTNLATAENNTVYLNGQVDDLRQGNNGLKDDIARLEAELATASARNRLVETELGLTYDPEEQGGDTDFPLEIEMPQDFAGQPEIAMQTDDTMAASLAEEETALDLAGMAPVEDEGHLEAFSVEAPESDMHTLADETQEIAEPEHTLLTPPPFTALITPMPEAEPDITTPALTPSFTATITPMAEPPVGAVAGSHDDLTVIEGIGPKIQELLFQYGIYSYRQLSETDVTRLREILATAGPQLAMHDPGTWPSQANLAANDEWDNLKAIQKFLKGGKKPT